MKAAIISIGDELLIGQTVNTNASWMGEQCTKNGITVSQVFTISDAEQEILDCLSYCQNKFEVVLITGGLGPTNDDITKKCIAKYLHVPLEQDLAVLENVKVFFKTFDRPVGQVNIEQANVPKGCTVLMNKVGTAPGMWMVKHKTVFVSMPGVPREMKYLMSEDILPKIRNEYNLPIIYSHNLLIQGIGESFIAEKIEKIEKLLPKNIKLAYLPSRGTVKLRITGKGNDVGHVKDMVNLYVQQIEQEIPDYVYGHNDDTLAAVLGEILTKQKLSVSVAESVTGGAITAAISSITGASNYFKGGIVAYQNSIKIQELEVLESTINENGVVSEQVAKQMAIGVRNKFQSDVSIATTGFAGPMHDASEIHPVGTVFIAIATNDQVAVTKLNLGGSRSGVIRRATLSALNLLRLQLKG